MKRRMLQALGITAVALLAAQAATAAAFVVTLDNDSTFVTRYRPVGDPTDDTKIMLLTEQGNWISLSRDIVREVTAQFETRGFGLVVDTTTIDLGFLLNDAEDPEAAEPPDPTTALIEALRGEPSAPYSVQQFAEPEEAGGIPIGWTRSTTPPIGGLRDR